MPPNSSPPHTSTVCFGLRGFFFFAQQGRIDRTIEVISNQMRQKCPIAPWSRALLMCTVAHYCSIKVLLLVCICALQPRSRRCRDDSITHDWEHCLYFIGHRHCMTKAEADSSSSLIQHFHSLFFSKYFPFSTQHPHLQTLTWSRQCHTHSLKSCH